MSAWLTAFRFDVSRNGRTLGFHGVFNFWQVLSDESSPVTFSRTAPEAIAEVAWASARCANLVDLKRIDRRARVRHPSSGVHPVTCSGSTAGVVGCAACSPWLTASLQWQPSRPQHPATTRAPAAAASAIQKCHGKSGRRVPALPAHRRRSTYRSGVGRSLQLHEQGNVPGRCLALCPCAAAGAGEPHRVALRRAFRNINQGNRLPPSN